jgi:flagellar hook-associated protein 1
MSLSASLSSALSGLQANARAAELVSSNVANALTEGYGRRELELSARSTGGAGSGVKVSGVLRLVDQVLLSDRRVAQAGAAGASATVDHFTRLESAVGTPDSASSLGQSIANLDAALLAATSRPDNEPRLADVLDAAKALVAQLGTASEAAQDERARADDRIARDVTVLNETLSKVDTLNARILRQVTSDRDASALLDQRQQLIDRIAEIVPIREIARDNGEVALVTTGGAILLDGRPAVFGFVPVGIVTADMTIASGALSGLTMNGRPVTFGGPGGKMEGGTLAADFAIRDTHAPAVQTQLDGVARDLIARFASPARDPSLAPGQPGLFTDGGAAFDPLTEPGLAGRLTVNAAADPSQGGALWRLRDGLGAAIPGSPGASRLLGSLQAALSEKREPLSGGFEPGQRSLAGLAADVISRISGRRLDAESAQGFSSANFTALRSDELAAGVDSDQQVQQLLLIEQAYGANAKVVQTIDEMIQLLLGI